VIKRLGNNVYTKPPDGSRKKRTNHSWTAQLGKYLAVTTQNLSLVGAAGVLGWFLDRHFSTYPFLMIIGIFAGAAAGLYHLIRFIDTEHKNSND